MENIRGEFPITLAGEERVMKCTGRMMDGLEAKLGKPVLRALHEALEGQTYFRDMVTVFHAGLAANKDTRLNREKVADAIAEVGMSSLLKEYIDILSYSLSGGKELEKDAAPGE